MRELIDINAVAVMVGGLHPRHVRQRLIKRPDFPRPFRIGAKISFDKSEVADWIEMQRQPIDGRTTRNLRSNAL